MKRCFVDTNVMLSVMDPSRHLHKAAVDLFDSAPGAKRVLVASGQVFRELLVVATRPSAVNGLGLSIPDAVRSADAFAIRVSILGERPTVATRLRRLIGDTACSGKQIHDANIVATMLIHGVTELVTANPVHFDRFSTVIDVVRLGAE